MNNRARSLVSAMRRSAGPCSALSLRPKASSPANRSKRPASTPPLFRGVPVRATSYGAIVLIPSCRVVPGRANPASPCRKSIPKSWLLARRRIPILGSRKRRQVQRQRCRQRFNLQPAFLPRHPRYSQAQRSIPTSSLC